MHFGNSVALRLTGLGCVVDFLYRYRLLRKVAGGAVQEFCCTLSTVCICSY
jgi:hypothetical protein